jgi:hypothetical protein
VGQSGDTLKAGEPTMKYSQRKLWPEFEDESPREEEADFVRQIVKGLGVPEQYTEKVTMRTFSDGAVSLKLNIDLTYDDVQSLCHHVK